MHVDFASRQLERSFTDEADAIRRWGPQVGRRYIMRVRLLQEARTLDDLLAIQSLRLHPLRGERSGDRAITLQGRWRLIIERPDERTVTVKEVTNHYGD